MFSSSSSILAFQKLSDDASITVVEQIVLATRMIVYAPPRKHTIESQTRECLGTKALLHCF
jgi:hypothetical protein